MPKGISNDAFVLRADVLSGDRRNYDFGASYYGWSKDNFPDAIEWLVDDLERGNKYGPYKTAILRGYFRPGEVEELEKIVAKYKIAVENQTADLDKKRKWFKGLSQEERLERMRSDWRTRLDSGQTVDMGEYLNIYHVSDEEYKMAVDGLRKERNEKDRDLRFITYPGIACFMTEEVTLDKLLEELKRRTREDFS